MAPPSFNTWTSIFLLVAIAGLFFSGIIYTQKKVRSINFPIIILIFGFSLTLIQYVFYWTGYLEVYPFLYFFDHTWYLLYGPLLYQYIVKFYNPSFTIKWFHYLPGAISFILNIIYYVKSGGYYHFSQFKDETLFYFFNSFRSPWVAAISLVIYIFIIKNFISFQGQGDSEYESFRNKWMSLLINLFSIFTLSYLSYFTLVQFSFFSTEWDYAISFSMTASIYAIGYMVYKEPSIFNGELLLNLFSKENNNDSLSEETKQEFYNTLLTYIETEKPYKDNNLRLVQLADEVGFSTHLLSKIINEKSGKNFNQFINEFRLIEAEKLLLQQNGHSIKTIYFEVGFNNKATFYKTFRQKHNCTPLAYQALHKTNFDKA